MTKLRLIGLTALSSGALCASAGAAAGPGTIGISAPKTVSAGHRVVITSSGRSNGFTRVYVFLDPGSAACRSTVAAERNIRHAKQVVHRHLHLGTYTQVLRVDRSSRCSHLICGYLTRGGKTARASARYLTR